MGEDFFLKSHEITHCFLWINQPFAVVSIVPTLVTAARVLGPGGAAGLVPGGEREQPRVRPGSVG